MGQVQDFQGIFMKGGEQVGEDAEQEFGFEHLVRTTLDHRAYT